MELGLSGKVALVTGGSSGIGRAVAIAFGREQAKVAITYRTNSQAAEATVGRIREAGGEGIAVYMDLADEASIKAARAAVLDRWGQIDALVANAIHWGAEGPNPDRRIEDVPLSEWRAMVDINLIGTVATVQAVLPAMRRQGAGRIVLISSDVVDEPVPGTTHYASAKGGLHGMFPSLVGQLGPVGIGVNIVQPGLTTTENNLKRIPQAVRDMVAARIPTRRLSTPEDVAVAIVFLASPLASNITGETLKVNGGWSW